MGAFVDLHCHAVPGVDDGVRTAAEARELLVALRGVGFEQVVLTPHMRPGLFDNEALGLRAAYDALVGSLGVDAALPRLGLAAEHYFDPDVLARIQSGGGLLYPGDRAVLLEFYDVDFLPVVAERLFALRRRRILPVIAHPERYRTFFRAPERLAELVDAGAAALLDLGAVVGKYGKEPERTARRLLDDGLYQAACSDAHRPADIAAVEAGIAWIRDQYGEDEITALLAQGPRDILSGRAET
ncbi:MAG: protein tyrosine phosphatase [Deltaproteobacteria bacterium]|nr:protein tyrosine phosphatase [Deltaproteobacteria bacterium]